MFRIAFHPIFAHPLPEGHRFPMQKYELLPFQLQWEGVATADDFFAPDILDEKWVRLVHQSAYVDAVLNMKLSPLEIRRIGFPMSEQLIERELRIAQGTIDGALHALNNKVAFNIAGGTHHAGSHWGEGFCIFNDQAIAAQYLLKKKKVSKVAIIDLDVHQGNGTAEIFQNHEQVFTFSMHGAKNFPFKKEKSNWDLALENGVEDDAYLQHLAQALPQIFETVKPDFVFYQSGVDVLKSDQLGKFHLSIEACQHRDEMLFKWAKKHQIPVQVSMGGGYSPHIKTIVEAHVNTFKAAKEVFGF